MIKKQSKVDRVVIRAQCKVPLNFLLLSLFFMGWVVFYDKRIVFRRLSYLLTVIMIKWLYIATQILFTGLSIVGLSCNHNGT